eukprot:TRINITY_DN1720_c0_g1_i1.p1 TRINITY_DN1720_c0_g1~~TRINITY_DN1720_c0_g1_i1.p1  ORF type:complete len:561 (-),score=113.64 TRINITY_DN1720_c0_g1_i1:109-1791(-)
MRMDQVALEGNLISELRCLSSSEVTWMEFFRATHQRDLHTLTLLLREKRSYTPLPSLTGERILSLKFLLVTPPPKDFFSMFAAFDLEEKSTVLWSPIEIACFLGDVDVASIYFNYLEAHLSKSTIESTLKLSLTIAAASGNDAIISECVARQFLTPHSQELITGPKGLLIESVKRGYMNVVVALCAIETLQVKSYPSQQPIWVVDESLVMAANHNKLDIVRWCVLNGAPHKVTSGKTAVVTAIKQGHRESVECLLENISCDASILLEEAILCNNSEKLEIVKYLLALYQVSPAVITRVFETLIKLPNFESDEDNLEIASMLLTRGASITTTALARAACVADDSLWWMIRTKYQAKEAEKTPLHILCTCERYKIWNPDWSQESLERGFRRIIDFLPNDVLTADWQGMKPLQLLIDRGIKYPNNKTTPLRRSTQLSYQDPAVQFPPLIRILLERGCAPLPRVWEITPTEADFLEGSMQPPRFMEYRQELLKRKRDSNVQARMSPLPLLSICYRAINNNRSMYGTEEQLKTMIPEELLIQIRSTMRNEDAEGNFSRKKVKMKD